MKIIENRYGNLKKVNYHAIYSGVTVHVIAEQPVFGGTVAFVKRPLSRPALWPWSVTEFTIDKSNLVLVKTIEEKTDFEKSALETELYTLEKRIMEIKELLARSRGGAVPC